MELTAPLPAKPVTHWLARRTRQHCRDQILRHWMKTIAALPDEQGTSNTVIRRMFCPTVTLQRTCWKNVIYRQPRRDLSYQSSCASSASRLRNICIPCSCQTGVATCMQLWRLIDVFSNQRALTSRADREWEAAACELRVHCPHP